MIKLFNSNRNHLPYTDLNSIRIITHLYTGHSYLRQHQHRIQNEQDLVCRFCDETEETVEHILARCPALANARWDILGEPEVKVSDLPTLVTPTKLIKFAKRINYLDLFDTPDTS